MHFLSNGGTSGNSPENRLQQYLAVKLYRFSRFQESRQMFVPPWHYFILEVAKRRRGLSQVDKVEVHFCNGFLSQELMCMSIFTVENPLVRTEFGYFPLKIFPY
jgi:hypothetical protein